MSTKVIINNYNYARYLSECLESVLAQTRPFDQVIVVDDGSTDESRTIIESYRDRNPSILPIFKENGGQLSCFNAALQYIDENDKVFLLDSDDLYPHDYVEKMLAEIDQETDHAFCRLSPFIQGEQDPIQNATINDSRSVTIPCSSYLTRYTGRFIGQATSANVFTGRLLRQLLPYPFERDWITAADRVLVVGASILGVRKKLVNSLAIAYRVHGSNHYYGKRFDTRRIAGRRLCNERMTKYICEKACLNSKVSYTQALFELFSLPAETRAEGLIPGVFILTIAPLLPLYRVVVPQSARLLVRKLRRIRP